MSEGSGEQPPVTRSSWRAWQNAARRSNLDEQDSTASGEVVASTEDANGAPLAFPAMSGDEIAEDPSDLRLEWPRSELDEDAAADEPSRPVVDDDPARVDARDVAGVADVADVAAVDEPSALGVDAVSRLGGVLGSLTRELRALTGSTEQLRRSAFERLISVEDVVNRTWTSNVDQLDELRNRTDESLSQIAKSVGDGFTRLRMVESQLEAAGDVPTLVAETLAAVQELAEANAQLVDQVAELSAALDASNRDVAARVDGVAAAVARVGALLQEATVEVPPDETEALVTALDEVRAAVRANGDRLAAQERRDDVTELAAAVDDLRGSFVTELAQLRAETSNLKRRIQLRAPSSQQDEAAGRLSDADLDEIVDRLVARLVDTFELVPQDEAPARPLRSPAKSAARTRAVRARPTS